MTATTSSRLLAVTDADLDRWFADAEPGPIPDGVGRGTALLRTGTWVARPFAAWARTGWKGKTFDSTGGRLRNRLTPFGILVIPAAVREDASWTDGRPCIVLDYSATSWVARGVRDEMRMIEPGLYLGVVFVRRRKLPIRFTLAFDA